MLNIEICHCMKVTLADIERVLFESKTMSDVEGAFESVQQQTKCSTGCGKCHDAIFDVISQLMSGATL